MSVRVSNHQGLVTLPWLWFEVVRPLLTFSAWLCWFFWMFKPVALESNIVKGLHDLPYLMMGLCFCITLMLLKELDAHLFFIWLYVVSILLSAWFRG